MKMSVKEHKLWKLFYQKAEREKGNAASFTTAVWEICQYGIDLSKTIRDTFKTYTLHDETHFCNVMTQMLNLIGDLRENLSLSECALLIMSACCHDIGMSISDEEKEYLRGWPDCMQVYLSRHPADYNIAHQSGEITDTIIQHYVRSEHHRRVRTQLMNVSWPEALGSAISVNELIAVCESHGEDVQTILKLGKYSSELDLLFCSVLLRLGDILDFDATRAPDSLYGYINLARLDGMENELSRLEWEKHKASRGFSFVKGEHPELLYRAECTNIQVEQAISSYLEWTDQELSNSRKMVSYMEARWKSLEIPAKVERQITAKGYLSGDYRFTLDQKGVLDLLIGRNLYSDPAVFVRELLQNAIDAVRTRKQLDKNLSRNWKPQINIRTWVDTEGCYWFRIEDNGIGMTEEMIRESFLKIGRSYYRSDQFQADRIRSEADEGYQPISRFGIGILSCFMSDSQNTCVEVTTKHFMENGTYYPAYRLSIKGVSGYYYLANEEEHRSIAPDMPDAGDRKQKFISCPGTVIAVRTNPYQGNNARSFKDIIDQYVVYPEIPVHYEGIEGCYDYETEQDFMDAVHRLVPISPDGKYEALARFPLPEQDFFALKEKYPDYTWTQKPSIAVYCLPLDYFTDSPLIKGATVFVNVEEEGYWRTEGLEDEYIPEIRFGIRCDWGESCYTLWTYFGLSSLAAANSLAESLLPELQLGLNQSHIRLNLDQDFPQRRSLISALQIEDFKDIPVNKARVYQAVVDTTFSRFPRAQIESLEWFQKWFVRHSHLINNKQGIFYGSVNAHNGIFSDTSFLLPFGTDFLNLTILMLKDEYCPDLNLSRNMIYELPLALNCTLEATANRMLCSLISNWRYRGYRSSMAVWHERISAQRYWQILDQNPSLASNLLFSTKKGDLSLEALEKQLQTQEKIELNAGYMGPFHLSVLLRSFDLKISRMDPTDFSVCLMKKLPGSSSDEMPLFTPAMFLYPCHDDITKLSLMLTHPDSDVQDSYCPYNASHPFSRWLIRNRDTLEKYVPGIYQQIIAKMFEGRGLIRNINLLLEQLRCLGHLGIKIADDLTEDDFCVVKIGW